MPAPKTVRIISPNQPFADWLGLLVDRRETLWFFIWKDLKVQYQKPIFGLIWSVFQPLVYFGIILWVMQFSGNATGYSTIPFSLYLISGLAIWNFTTSSILGAINSIQSNAGIISKSFFPRFYLILSPVLKSTIDLLIMLLLVFALALYLGQAISFTILGFVPVSLALVWFTTLGWSAIAASLVVSNRHIRHAISVLLYAMIFAMPVFYSLPQVNHPLLHFIYDWNPIIGAMEALRSCFATQTLDFELLVWWLLQSVLWLAIGIVVFRKMEKTLADKV